MKRNINESYFERISSKDRAYWLGFILADGYIYSNKVFGIEIQSRDGYLIEKFRDTIYPDKKLSFRKRNENWSETITLKFTNKNFCEHLKDKGCVEHKSDRLKFPKIDKRFISHFLRGFFDGDGGFYVKKTNGKPKLEITSISKEFLLDYQKHLKRLGINSYVYSRQRKGNRKESHSLQIFAKKDLKKIFDLFYKDSNGLRCERKFSSFEVWNKK